MKTIYFIRHGEAEINPTAEKKPAHVKGGLAELSPRGFVQSEKIAERLANLPVEVLIASTLVRAQQTAATISKRIAIPIVSSDLFIERHEPSSLIGLPWSDPSTQQLLDKWVQTFSTVDERVGDGENFGDVNTRARNALTFLSQRPEDHIAVVTHGDFLRHMLGQIFWKEKCTPQLVESLACSLRTSNTGLSLVHYDPSDTRSTWYVVTWNDHAHLG